MSSFFDNFKDAAADSLAGIVDKSKTGLQASRLRSQIRRLEKEMQERYRLLGERLYRMIKSQAIDGEAFSSEYNTINALEQQHSHIKAEITKLEGMLNATAMDDGLVRCTCGEALNAEMRFCRGCGKDVQDIVAKALAKQQESQSSTRICDCGAKLTATAKFCMQCGKAVIQEQTTSTEQPQSQPQPQPVIPAPAPRKTFLETEANVPDTVAEPADITPPSTTRNCPLCNGEIPINAKFCRHCGKNITDNKS